jgi:nucleotide-binding universal stress UspA family protein
MSDFKMLLCVDGSPAALEAARFALNLAAKLDGEVRAIAVVENHETTRDLGPRYRVEQSAAERLEQGARAVLERIAAMGAESRVRVETAMLHGDALRAVIGDARAFEPDLMLIGRTGRSGPGSSMLGSLALQLLEFAECPVVVVPEAASAETTDAAAGR